MTDDDKKRSRLRAVVRDYVRRFLDKGPTPPPGDPHAHALVPLRGGPKGRSGAAVAEPEENSFGSFPPRRQ